MNTFPRYRSRPPWFGADLQTLRNFIVRVRPDFSATDERTLQFPMGDGTGDVLIGTLNAPRRSGRSGGKQKPLVILIHGLTGCFESFHVLLSAEYLLSHGYPVLRLNLRGAGPSSGHCREQYHAGRSEDFRQVMKGLDGALTKHGVAAAGYSLGANMLLKYLGEEGSAAPLVAAASVSAPVDLAAAAQRFLRTRNMVYHRYMLSRMKVEAAAHPDALTPEQRRAVAEAATVYGFDDVYVAPRYGFKDAEDYYAKCMARRFLPGIRVPTLVIHAADDPWIPIAAYAEVDWGANPALTPLFAAGGGHAGFHARGSMAPWHDRCIERFLEGI